MNCKYLLRRQEKYKYYFYCKYSKKKVETTKCKDCKNKEYKEYKTIKNKTNKLKKIEDNRFSILTDDLNTCYVCGAKKQDLHEVYSGKNRKISMKYGCVIPFCRACHNEWDINKKMSKTIKMECQKRFMDYYNKNVEDFIKIFGRNYL